MTRVSIQNAVKYQKLFNGVIKVRLDAYVFRHNSIKTP